MKMKDGIPVVECVYSDDRKQFLVGCCPLCGGEHAHGAPPGSRHKPEGSIVGHRGVHCMRDITGSGYYLELREDLTRSAGDTHEDIFDRQKRAVEMIDMQPGEDRKVFLIVEDGKPTGIDIIPDFGGYCDEMPYYIEWGRINTHDKAIGWMGHLSGKVWGTQVIGQLFAQLHRCGVIEFRGF